EVAAEALAQVGGLALQAPCERLVAPHLTGQAGRAAPRVVHVALDLTGRDRPLGQRAVGELDRVPAVLPALVDQSGGRVAASVLDVPIAIGVPAGLDPGQRRTSMGLERADKLIVARPTVVLVKENQEQRRCVGAPVVRGVRALPARGELAKAQLVQDLARLLFV